MLRKKPLENFVGKGKHADIQLATSISFFFPKQPQHLMTFGKKLFENNVGKGDDLGNNFQTKFSCNLDL